MACGGTIRNLPIVAVGDAPRVFGGIICARVAECVYPHGAVETGLRLCED